MNVIIPAILSQLEGIVKTQDIQYYFFGMPHDVSKSVLIKGLIIIEPVSTAIEPITTGIQDQETATLKLVVMKNLQGVPKNAQKETGAEFMTRVIEGKNGKVLDTTSIRFVLRSYFRSFGLLEQNMIITYDTEEITNDGAVTATITFDVINHTNIQLNS